MYLWRHGEWVCDYIRVDGQLLIRLYRGDHCVRQEPVKDAPTGWFLAVDWRKACERGHVELQSHPLS